PGFEVGYQLPSGFGEFVFGYRFLATSGTEQVLAFDHPATLDSRLEMHVFDLDYASREWSLWPDCGMKWRFGLRLASIYFDSHLGEPFAEAAASHGFFAEQDSNLFVGFGP